ncbi:MAG: molybdopterin molybdotransferase MoeA [Candidatus Solibacter usitatus]|nr:molybdopterin molybdotransferase MoeA [Candidatus Solibacter usitatus]
MEARTAVLERLAALALPTQVERVALQDVDGRVMAEEIRADRDSPPLARSIRDGFAVRAASLPGTLRIIGEVRAGEISGLHVGPGEALEIMTGAPVPPGADCIVMVEHTDRLGGEVRIERTQKPGDFINPAGAEGKAGGLLLSPGERVTFPRVAMLASAGCATVAVHRRPRVAILSTGDEVVPLSQVPQPHQVRNSNAHSLAAQVRRAGGDALILPVAADRYDATRDLIETGLREDLLLISGGVSAGKYDIVEKVLADLGTEFYFTRVRIQPGQPLVFGRARDRFFFGLPGNPASTMVTCEVFARAAVEFLSGIAHPALPLFHAALTEPFRHKPGLTRFLPAAISPDGRAVTPVRYHGSSDIPALARANAFLVAEEARESWERGELISVLPI